MILRYEIEGNSMMPSFKPGDRILVWETQKVKIGDVVVFSKSGLDCIKRVYSEKGDELFVLGDNKEESTDSRHYGLIARKQVLGKAMLKY